MKYTKIKRLLGTKSEHIEGAKVAVLMLLATVAYELLSRHFIPDYHFNMWEFIGTWTGLICVWLSRTTNILCWPWGIISSAALGIFFSQIGLPGQQWLNWGYFVVIQLWAWPHWAFGGKEKDDLPVTVLSLKARILTILATLLSTVAIYSLIDVFVPGSSYPWMDALVVSASIIAQYLLGQKKVESWILWLGPVNMISIVLFFLTGAYTLTALYIAFFIHAAFALNKWAKVNK
ncbi:MAG: nicotinamide riboside transporter PnuC [Candidatus Nomurabacteria bacterium]|nr:nicotinamide riboside transporter PnuC [Candidatus Nomurabacteria bacterium]